MEIIISKISKILTVALELTSRRKIGGGFEAEIGVLLYYECFDIFHVVNIKCGFR